MEIKVYQNVWRIVICMAILSPMLQCFSYNILAIFPHTGKSHHIMFEPLLRELASKGHQLTVISHYPMKEAPKSYKEISLAGTMHLNVHICDFDDFMFLSGAGSIIRHIMATYELFDLGNLNCNAMTSHQGVINLMHSNETFDLIITEQFNSDCAFGIINKFKSPVVAIATHVPMPWTLERFGMPENPAYVSSHFLNHCRHPNFFESVASSIVNTYYKIAYFVNTHILEYRFLGNGFLQSRWQLDAIAKNMSLLMITTYYPLHGALVYGPNVVEIGGVHLPKSLQPVSPDIQNFMDESDGFIYFSMGSMIRGKSLPIEKLKAFQEVFATFPQYKVLWKWENDTMPGKTDQIMIRPWMPQYEILSHHKIKAFVSHGGLLGLTEAVNRGVPVIVIPLFGDQFVNGAAAEESGLGRVLSFEDMTVETIKEALGDILKPKIQASAKRLSEVWKDRPQSPLETAVYWVEHVARHGGKHLRPASADLPFYRYLLLDVIAFLSLVGSVLAFITYKILQCMFRTVSKHSLSKNKSD